MKSPKRTSKVSKFFYFIKSLKSLNYRLNYSMFSTLYDVCFLERSIVLNSRHCNATPRISDSPFSPVTLAFWNPEFGIPVDYQERLLD